MMAQIFLGFVGAMNVAAAAFAPIHLGATVEAGVIVILCLAGALVAACAIDDLDDDPMQDPFGDIPWQAAADRRGEGSRPPKQCHSHHDGSVTTP